MEISFNSLMTKKKYGPSGEVVKPISGREPSLSKEKRQCTVCFRNYPSVCTSEDEGAKGVGE